MLCKKLHHAAYRCRDAAETVRFYTEVLGLKFTHVMGDDHVPSTKEYSPHIHIFFQLEDGSHIAFFECPKSAGNMKDLEMPEWIQHFAFEVENLEVLRKAKKNIEIKGHRCRGRHRSQRRYQFDLFLRSLGPSSRTGGADAH